MSLEPPTIRDILIWSWVAYDGNPAIVMNPLLRHPMSRTGVFNLCPPPSTIAALRDKARPKMTRQSFITVFDTGKDDAQDRYRRVCAQRCAWRPDVLMPVIRYESGAAHDLLFIGYAPTVAILGRLKDGIPLTLADCFVITYDLFSAATGTEPARYAMFLTVGGGSTRVAVGTAYEIARLTCCLTDILFVPNSASVAAPGDDMTLVGETIGAFVRTQDPTCNWTRRYIVSPKADGPSPGLFSDLKDRFTWLSDDVTSFREVADMAKDAAEAWGRSKVWGRSKASPGVTHPSDSPRNAWNGSFPSTFVVRTLSEFAGHALHGGTALVSDEEEEDD